MADDRGLGHNGGPSYDYGEDGKTEAKQTTVEHVTELVHKMHRCEHEVASAEAELKARQKALKEVCEFEIPKALDDAKVKDLTTLDDLFVEVAENLRVSLPGRDNPKRAKAFEYLNKLGLGSIAKRTVTIQYGKGEEEAAAKLAEELEERGLNVTEDLNVHAATLKKNLNDLLEDGQDVDLSLFNGYIVRAAKVKKKK